MKRQEQEISQTTFIFSLMTLKLKLSHEVKYISWRHPSQFVKIELKYFSYLRVFNAVILLIVLASFIFSDVIFLMLLLYFRRWRSLLKDEMRLDKKEL